MQSYDFSKCEIYQEWRYALTDYLCDVPGEMYAHVTYADDRNRLYVCDNRLANSRMIPLADYYAYGLYNCTSASREY